MGGSRRAPSIGSWSRSGAGTMPRSPTLSGTLPRSGRMICGTRSVSSVYGIIQQLDPALVMLAHHGPKVYRETFDLIHRHVCGIPQGFYTDHGSDFTSRHLEQVAADLKIELIFSTVDMPRGRGKIERLFETINQLFLCEVPGYTPPGAPPATPHLTLDAFEARFRTFLLEQYHHRIHSETTMTPQARWEAEGFLPHLPESLEQLDLLLLTIARTRRVQQDGIRFQGLRYLDLNLAAYVGEDVTLRYDPRDMAEIRVYHGDTFICHAVCQELAGQTISLKEI